MTYGLSFHEVVDAPSERQMTAVALAAAARMHIAAEKRQCEVP